MNKKETDRDRGRTGKQTEIGPDRVKIDTVRQTQTEDVEGDDNDGDDDDDVRNTVMIMLLS